MKKTLSFLAMFFLVTICFSSGVPQGYADDVTKSYVENEITGADYAEPEMSMQAAMTSFEQSECSIDLDMEAYRQTDAPMPKMPMEKTDGARYNERRLCNHSGYRNMPERGDLMVRCRTENC